MMCHHHIQEKVLDILLSSRACPLYVACISNLWVSCLVCTVLHTNEMKNAGFDPSFRYIVQNIMNTETFSIVNH